MTSLQLDRGDIVNMEQSLNILILSSFPASHSANLCGDVMTALEEAGHRVYFGYPGIEKLFAWRQNYKPKRYSLVRRIWNRLQWYYRRIFNIAYIEEHGYLISPKGYVMFMPFEEKPNIPSSDILGKLNGPYDMVLFHFFENMTTMSIVKAIDEKFHCPIVLVSPDMYPMTGGCYYFNHCRNFENECYDCPIFHSRDNLAHRNFIYKKQVYSTTKTCFYGNTWMNSFAEKSKIFENAYIYNGSFILDEDVFKPLDRTECRKELGILGDYDLVIFNRYKNMKRKGIEYFNRSMDIFLCDLSADERKKILLVTIDQCDNRLSERLGIEVVQFGRVDIHKLIEIYNASDLFLCSSVDDAGPSMINQSIACGTPVVAFDTGTAIDVVETGTSGYCAKYKDSNDLAAGLHYIYSMKKEEYEQLRLTTREMAIRKNSKKAFADSIRTIYKHFNH